LHFVFLVARSGIIRDVSPLISLARRDPAEEAWSHVEAFLAEHLRE
jgi:hypothetical protein